jgi:hypothetical protein
LLIQKKNNDAIRREAAKYLGTVITRNVWSSTSSLG